MPIWSDNLQEQHHWFSCFRCRSFMRQPKVNHQGWFVVFWFSQWWGIEVDFIVQKVSQVDFEFVWFVKNNIGNLANFDGRMICLLLCRFMSCSCCMLFRPIEWRLQFSYLAGAITAILLVIWHICRKNEQLLASFCRRTVRLLSVNDADRLLEKAMILRLLCVLWVAQCCWSNEEWGNSLCCTDRRRKRVQGMCRGGRHLGWLLRVRVLWEERS